MSDSEQTETTCEPVKRGFGSVLRCLHCGEAGCLAINLHTLTDDDSIRCGNCEADYGLDEVREVIEAWGKVLAWVEAAPQLEE